MYVHVHTPRGSGDAVDAPVSLALHNFGMNVIVLALCRDVHLRLWSVEVREHAVTLYIHALTYILMHYYI